MLISILHNRDHELLENDPGREAREDVVRVAAALADALTRGKVNAEPLAVEGDGLAFVEGLRQRKPNLVVNLCESLAADSRGEMVVPCLLDMLNIPYTGSSALSLGLALHKDKAKELLRARGVSTPEFRLVEHPEDLATVDLPFPLIVKPAREDASVGVSFDSVVCDPPSLGRAVMTVLKTFEQPALVEQFVAGREIYVPVLGNNPRRALPLSEIHFGAAFQDKPKIVSYAAKWLPESPECVDSPSGPCVLDKKIQAKAVDVAFRAFAALGCRDYGRVDLRLSEAGDPFVIDINPNCDLHPGAGFAKAAAAAGIDYPSLAQRLVEIAVERSHGNSSDRAARPGSPVRLVAQNRNVLAARGGVRARGHRRRAQAE
ncbi:MAG: D-alanine--D-alanine ligase family protein [Myxococcaceae bacterium]